jgi:hypothetical protein
MQRLLGEAVWDADAVRDDVRGYVVDALANQPSNQPGDQLGDVGGVLILDDTADRRPGPVRGATDDQDGACDCRRCHPSPSHRQQGIRWAATGDESAYASLIKRSLRVLALPAL